MRQGHELENHVPMLRTVWLLAKLGGRVVRQILRRLW